ncbi:MAG TPA: phenylacetic acid degradation operon negative regulatory protein PaaX [Casimicrobiaceae bacterium]|nr:phenylacetic acid degradation operon negative regulatory protein PaaX [Casimicrobiaceae bacterium]
MTGAGLPSRSPPRAAIARWIRRELEREPPRAKSLVVTVWGDAIAPHGGAVWLGSLIRLLAPFGLNERLVRTSVYRLTQLGWLEARQDGRRSLYRLTAAGAQRFEHAYRRIYAAPADGWDGTWEVVLAPAARVSASQRRELRQQLRWEGFGPIAPGVLVRPSHHAGTDLARILTALGVEREVVTIEGRGATGRGAEALRAYARASWDLARVAAEYRAFLRRFGAIARQALAVRALDRQQAFLVRTLLIHAFRRVTLHDPQLPAELSPPRWPAPQAYALCRDLYRVTSRAAEAHLAATLGTEHEPLRPAAPYFCRRFGGL